MKSLLVFICTICLASPLMAATEYEEIFTQIAIEAEATGTEIFFHLSDAELDLPLPEGVTCETYQHSTSGVEISSELEKTYAPLIAPTLNWLAEALSPNDTVSICRKKDGRSVFVRVGGNADQENPAQLTIEVYPPQMLPLH